MSSLHVQGTKEIRATHRQGLSKARLPAITCLAVAHTFSIPSPWHTGALWWAGQRQGIGLLPIEMMMGAAGHSLPLPKRKTPHSTPTAPWHQRPGRATHSSNTSVPLLSPLAGPAAPKCLDSHVPALSLSSQAGRLGRVEGTEENPHCSPAKWGCLDTSGQPVPDTEQPLFGPRCQPR